MSLLRDLVRIDIVVGGVVFVDVALGAHHSLGISEPLQEVLHGIVDNDVETEHFEEVVNHESADRGRNSTEVEPCEVQEVILNVLGHLQGSLGVRSVDNQFGEFDWLEVAV